MAKINANDPNWKPPNDPKYRLDLALADLMRSRLLMPKDYRKRLVADLEAHIRTVKAYLESFRPPNG